MGVIGGHPLDGIVINNGKQGFTFKHLSRCPGMGYEFEPSLQPKEFWSSLKKNGIFDLPDENKLKLDKRVVDGICYVVEYKLLIRQINSDISITYAKVGS